MNIKKMIHELCVWGLVSAMCLLAPMSCKDSETLANNSDTDSGTDSGTNSDAGSDAGSDTDSENMCKVAIIVSVDWEGRDLENSNILAFKNFRTTYPEVPILQFLNAAYFTKSDAVLTEVAQTIKSVLLPIDEHGLHIHGWKSLFEAADVEHRRSPDFWDGGELSDADCEYDCGHAIPISEYTTEELAKVILLSQKIHSDNGFDEATSFRTGGWIGTNNVLEALQETSFSYDHSEVPVEHIADKLSDYLIFEWLSALWTDTTITSQPYYILDDLLEVPDNGCLADYMSGEDMFDVFKANAALCQNNPNDTYYVSIGFHQETASAYVGRIAQAIDLIREYAAEEGVSIEFRTRPY